MRRVLRRWQQLPEMGVWPQLSVLQSFQQIVELQESSRLLVDLGLGGRPDHPYGELKVSLKFIPETPNPKALQPTACHRARLLQEGAPVPS